MSESPREELVGGGVSLEGAAMTHGTPAGAITTLGRGGSDLTATVLGAALGVDEVQVWKDVDGELTFPHLYASSVAQAAMPLSLQTHQL